MSRLSLLLLLLCSTIFTFTNAVAQSYSWVRGGGTNQSFSVSMDQETVSSMCTDPNGNVYALSKVGINAVIADTFHWPGGIGSSRSILFTSHNCNGQMRFAKLITGTGNTPHGVVADNMGHVYIAFDGAHSSTNPLRIRHDTTIGAFTNSKETLVQFDTLGDLKWIRFVGDNTYSTATGTGGAYNYLALDGLQNPHLVAIAEYGVVLSPTVTADRIGFYDHRYDIAGNLLSVNRLDIDSSLFVNGLTIDKQSNKMYAYGRRNYNDFPDSSRYEFIAAFDVNRNRIWIDTLGNPVVPLGKTFSNVTADSYGHLYVTAVASGKVTYRGDTAVNELSTTPYQISVVMKMDTAGNSLWMRTFSATISVNSLTGLTLFGTNKLAASGVMAGMVTCSTDTMSIYSGEGQNAYFTILDTAGYVHELKQIHGAGFYDYAYHVVAGKSGNLYIGGKLENNIWGGSLTPYTSVGGDSDYFIMKYGVDCGCTAMPVANYAYTGTDLTRSLTYTGTAGIDSVRWTFGDGGTSTSMSPVHTYTSAGTYTTCVRVYSPCGNDMRCHEIEVSCTTVPSAAYADTGNYVHGFMYTGTTTAFYDSVRWDFNDGTFDTGLNVIHTYAVADTYHVCAKVYTRCGTDTFCTDVIILDTTTTVSALQLADYDVKIFPNPATNELYVSGIPHTATFRILNVVGVTMLDGELHKGTNTISAAQLPPGIYVLEITAVNGSKKVVRIMKE